MIDRLIFEASRGAAASRVGRSERTARVDRGVFEGLRLISSTRVLRWRRIGGASLPAASCCSRHEGRHEGHTRQTAYPHLAQCPGVLAPAEDLFDALAQALTGQVAAMARRAPIDRRAARTLERLGDVRRHTQLTAGGDEATGVIPLVPGHRSAGARAWRLSILSAASRSANPLDSVISTSTGRP